MSNSSQPKNSYQGFEAQEIKSLIKDSTIDLSGTGASMHDITITNSYSGQTYAYSDSGTVITLTPSVAYNYNTTGGGGTYTISSGSGSDTITLTGIDNFSAYNIPVEWIDCLPPFSRIQDMCEKYPGLKIAYDNFKVFYEMVKDDYDNPTPKK